MALDDNALFTAAKGYIFVGAVGATPPTSAEIAAFDPATGLAPAWTNLGHTDRDNLPEFGFDGGDAETRGTWQNETLKEVITAATVDYVTFNLLQFDEIGLALYYGQENAVGAPEGEFHVTNPSTTGTERALCMIVVDGDAKIGFYARKTSVRRNDSVTMATDAFAALPLRSTFLKDGTNELFRWISQDIPVNAEES